MHFTPRKTLSCRTKQQLNLSIEEVNSNIVLPKCQNPIAQLAQKALLKEIFLTPKPGLVDQKNNGAHHDMNLVTFLDSIQAISPWLDQFYSFGQASAFTNAQEFLGTIRKPGICCEREMCQATNGINTHKGMIFAFGLLLSASGRLNGQSQKITAAALSKEVSQMCQDIINKELQNNNHPHTSGIKQYQQYGLTGARGEAASGYQTVTRISLPHYLKYQNSGCSEEQSLLQALLHLMAHNQDSNIIARGGIEALRFVQTKAQEILAQGGVLSPAGINKLIEFDQILIQKHLSPGGSADLLAITWFLAQIELGTEI